MAQRFISAIGLALLASAAYAQAFGRFGYVQNIVLPGIQVDKEGFVATDQSAERIRFGEPSSIWKPVSTSETEQIVLLSGGPGNPSKAIFSLLGVGFSLYFESGIDLRVRSKGAPYLSWQEGSVAENVATPDVTWIVLSFHDRQPPIVIGFPNGHASLIVSGKPGDWSIQSSDKFRGWVRVALPNGLEGKLANSAGTLGLLARGASQHVQLWTAMPPKLLKTSLADDLYSVTATWQFDHPGAVVPTAAELAYLGGYLIEVRSKTVRMPGWTESGPVDILKGDSLTIRFPVRRVPTGRSLAVGSHVPGPVAAASSEDISSVVSLGLHALTGDRDPLARKAAEDTISNYVSQAAYHVEPWTRQQLPFAANGNGVELAAAQAFLMQAVTITSQATSESNSLLTSVSWRQDWLTWRVWASDEANVLRAGALAALAGALCPESERRLSAGMFQAGLSARRGLDVWKKREGLIDSLPKMIEPLYGLRKGLFGLSGPEEDAEAFTLTLMSPLRVFGDAAVTLIKEGNDYRLKISSPKGKSAKLMLASAYPIDATAGTNVQSIKVAAALGFTEIHYTPKNAGDCEIDLKLPSFGKPPPAAVPVPSYSESQR